MAQDPENTTNSLAYVKLAVRTEVLEWVKDEQTRIRKATGKEPTQHEVIQALIAERDAPRKSPPITPDKAGKIAVPKQYLVAVQAFLEYLQREPQNPTESKIREFVLGILKVPLVLENGPDKMVGH